jgi:hypothetical protein
MELMDSLMSRMLQGMELTFGAAQMKTSLWTLLAHTLIQLVTKNHASSLTLHLYINPLALLFALDTIITPV